MSWKQNVHIHIVLSWINVKLTENRLLKLFIEEILFEVQKSDLMKTSLDYYNTDSLAIWKYFSWCSLENDARIVQESMNTLDVLLVTISTVFHNLPPSFYPNLILPFYPNLTELAVDELGRDRMFQLTKHKMSLLHFIVAQILISVRLGSFGPVLLSSFVLPYIPSHVKVLNKKSNVLTMPSPSPSPLPPPFQSRGK